MASPITHRHDGAISHREFANYVPEPDHSSAVVRVKKLTKCRGHAGDALAATSVVETRAN